MSKLSYTTRHLCGKKYSKTKKYYRVAQLAEFWSPKPAVGGSTPSTVAKNAGFV